MKTLKNIIPFVLFVIIGIPVFILFLPIMAILFPINSFQRKRFEKKYAEFLIENNGVNFFCYNNRKKSKEYIEQNIILKSVLSSYKNSQHPN